MKLAEALMLRADLQTRLQELRQRISNNAIVQEGEAPAENPQDLLNQVTRVTEQMADMVRKINRTNQAIEIEAGVTITDALATRDMWITRQSIYNQAAQAGTLNQYQYGQSQIKMQGTVDVPSVRQMADEAARSYRELDARIQALNWMVDLIE